MASTMFATELTTSAFMGTAMATSAAVSGPARVTMMGFSKDDLERKPLSLIRTLVRQKGLPMSTKAVMIQSLLGAKSYSSPSPGSYSNPRSSSSTSGGANDGEYGSKTLGELRSLAKARGLRGDTRAEIIALLKSAPAPAAESNNSSFSSPSYGSAEAPKGLPKAQLERKSLAELRAMARIRGLRGDTKAELVALLADNGSAGGSGSSGSASSHSAPSYSSNGNGSFSSSSNGASSGGPSLAVRQLSVKSLSQLRAMAAIRGIRGSTKQELVRQLSL